MAEIVNVTVAEYVPGWYTASLVSIHANEAALPALAVPAPAPKAATGVETVVEAVCVPVQAVPGAATVQV